jgi:hypothetical protein
MTLRGHPRRVHVFLAPVPDICRSSRQQQEFRMLTRPLPSAA